MIKFMRVMWDLMFEINVFSFIICLHFFYETKTSVKRNILFKIDLIN